MSRTKARAPMEIEMVRLDQITPYENNPRDISEAVDAVAASLKEFGWLNPIEVDDEGVIIRGHTRYAAAKKLGLKEVPVIRADDLTQQEAKAFRLADNKTAELAEWDDEKKAQELDDLKEFEPTMAVFGFDDSEFGDWHEDDPDNEEPENHGQLPTNQYAVIVMCRDEAHQETVYDSLTQRGFNCRVVAT